MPAISPEAISNLVRLSYEFATLDGRFVAEHGAVDSLLPAVIEELSPDEHGIAGCGPQDNLFARPNEQFTLSAIRISVGAVVPLIKIKAITISILRQPPMPRFTTRLISGVRRHQVGQQGRSLRRLYR